MTHFNILRSSLKKKIAPPTHRVIIILTVLRGHIHGEYGR